VVVFGGERKMNCLLETMYGYSDCGEIIKRDLYSGDVLGIRELYN